MPLLDERYAGRIVDLARILAAVNFDTETPPFLRAASDRILVVLLAMVYYSLYNNPPGSSSLLQRCFFKKMCVQIVMITMVVVKKIVFREEGREGRWMGLEDREVFKVPWHKKLHAASSCCYPMLACIINTNFKWVDV